MLLRTVATFLAAAMLTCASPANNPSTTTVTKTTTVTPTPTAVCKNAKAYVDTFDNYTVSATGTSQSIGFDGGLSYVGWGAGRGAVNNLGLIPPSQPNVASTNVPTDAASGNGITMTPYGSITIAGTSAKSFQLLEFWYGCGLEDEIGGTVGKQVQTCTIEVYGYDIYGNRVGSAGYNFAPNKELAPMSRAVLPLYYLLLQNVTIALPSAGSTTATSVLNIDNVTHVNCY